MDRLGDWKGSCILAVVIVGAAVTSFAKPGVRDWTSPSAPAASCAVVPQCQANWFVDIPEFGTGNSSSSLLTEVRTEIDQHGYGWQAFYVDGKDSPILRRLTIGGELAVNLGETEWEFYHIGIPDEEAVVILWRDLQVGGAYILEPPPVFIDEGYKRTIDGVDGNITIEFAGFEDGIIEGEPDGRCVQYRRGRLRFTTPDGVYEVADSSYLITEEWVITVSAALRFVDGCIPAEFRPNIQYAIFRRAW